jgi:hypothetical protein
VLLGIHLIWLPLPNPDLVYMAEREGVRVELVESVKELPLAVEAVAEESEEEMVVLYLDRTVVQTV